MVVKWWYFPVLLLGGEGIIHEAGQRVERVPYCSGLGKACHTQVKFIRARLQAGAR